MKIQALCLTIAALLSGAGEASAQDTVFSGPNVSAGVSYTDLSVDQALDAAPGRLDRSDTAAGYQVAAGYDWQFGNLVVGGQVGARFGGPSVSGRVGAVDATGKAGLSWDYSARAGIVVSDRALIYGRIGGARTRLTQTTTPVGSTVSTRRAATSDGLTYGAGVEFAVTDTWAIRGEYSRAEAEGDTTRSDLTLSAVARF